MALVKRQRVVLAVGIIFLSMLLGTVIGWALAEYEVREIARQVRAKNPRDPLDGLPFIGLGIMVIGFVLGTVTGIVGAVVFWLTNKGRAAREAVDSSYSHPV